MFCCLKVKKPKKNVLEFVEKVKRVCWKCVCVLLITSRMPPPSSFQAQNSPKCYILERLLLLFFSSVLYQEWKYIKAILIFVVEKKYEISNISKTSKILDMLGSDDNQTAKCSENCNAIFGILGEGSLYYCYRTEK